MSFFARLFKKHTQAKPAPQQKPADRSVPTRTNPDTLTELRHQARTGDPTLSGKHRSGNF